MEDAYMKTIVTGSQVLLLAAGLSMVAYGNIVNSAEADSHAGDFPNDGPCQNFDQGAGTRHTNCSVTGPFGEIGSSSASVNYGFIGLFSSFTNKGQSNSAGDMNDVLTFADPLVPNGTALGVFFSVIVSGTEVKGPGFLGSACWQLQVTAGSDFLQKGDCGGTNDPFGTYSIAATVLSGMPTQFSVVLTTDASASAGGSATIDMTHSFEWGGIQSVTQNGQAVSFTLSSASGTDYHNSFAPSPVPEPASGFLMVGLLGVVALCRRRRTTSH
jgi:hypothetical protein